MTFCIEWNITPQTEFDDIHIDSVEKVSERNRRMLEQGKVPTYFVIGYAPTLGEARKFADEYKALNPR